MAERIIATTNGNPLALIELPASLTEDELRGAVPLRDPLPIDAHVADVFAQRARALKADARMVLLLAAAERVGDPALLRHAAATEDLSWEQAVASAEESGLVTFTPRVAFRHPLVRSAIYDSAAPAERRRAHAALAEALDGDGDADRRAWHLGAATLTPDEQVASELEASAERARRRGGSSVAAEYLWRAVELTPDPERATERLLDAARGVLDRRAGQAGTADARSSDRPRRRGRTGGGCGVDAGAGLLRRRRGARRGEAPGRRTVCRRSAPPRARNRRRCRRRCHRPRRRPPHRRVDPPGDRIRHPAHRRAVRHPLPDGRVADRDRDPTGRRPDRCQPAPTNRCHGRRDQPHTVAGQRRPARPRGVLRRRRRRLRGARRRRVGRPDAGVGAAGSPHRGARRAPLGVELPQLARRPAGPSRDPRRRTWPRSTISSRSPGHGGCSVRHRRHRCCSTPGAGTTKRRAPAPSA